MFDDDPIAGGLLVVIEYADNGLFTSPVLLGRQLLLKKNTWLPCSFGKFDPGTFAEVDVENNAFRK